MAGRCYTLDVNPTSNSRVKARLYETRAVEAGGNILLLQGQLSVKQFEALEALFLAGAEREGAVVLRLGRHYELPSLSRTIETPMPKDEAASAARRSHLSDDDDYDALARLHVERMLRRQRAHAS